MQPLSLSISLSLSHCLNSRSPLFACIFVLSVSSLVFKQSSIPLSRQLVINRLVIAFFMQTSLLNLTLLYLLPSHFTLLLTGHESARCDHRTSNDVHPTGTVTPHFNPLSHCTFHCAYSCFLFSMHSVFLSMVTSKQRD